MKMHWQKKGNTIMLRIAGGLIIAYLVIMYPFAVIALVAAMVILGFIVSFFMGVWEGIHGGR